MILALPSLLLLNRITSKTFHIIIFGILTLLAIVDSIVVEKLFGVTVEDVTFLKISLVGFYALLHFKKQVTVMSIFKGIILLLTPFTMNLDFIPVPAIGISLWLIFILTSNQLSNRSIALVTSFPILLLLNDKVIFTVFGTNIDLMNKIFYQSPGWLNFLPLITSLMVLVWLALFALESFRPNNIINSLNILFFLLLKERILNATLINEDHLFLFSLSLLVGFPLLGKIWPLENVTRRLLVLMSIFLSPWLIVFAYVLEVLEIINIKGRLKSFKELFNLIVIIFFALILLSIIKSTMVIELKTLSIILSSIVFLSYVKMIKSERLN